jgi:RsiW-degrading membrane proteinase PrsW (M82 family)
MAPPPPPPSFIDHAALFSLIAPCIGIAVILLGRRALSESPVGMPLVGAVCSLIAAAGFVFGVVAYFAPKGAAASAPWKAIAGICINGLLISFAILSITRQKVAASENNTPDPPRKPWSYISGK